MAKQCNSGTDVPPTEKKQGCVGSQKVLVLHGFSFRVSLWLISSVCLHIGQHPFSLVLRQAGLSLAMCSNEIKVKVKVRVLSLDPKLALTTSQF